MENKVNYIQAINFKNLISYMVRQWQLKKIRQNPEKWGCGSLRCILMAEFHSY